jgi:AcrR family transcriptional regulator
MSKREEAKAERRRRIVAAARELIKETGDVGLSMRAIAARAGVSLTTPYNLFGSKRAIVVAVLEDVREFHERFSSLHQVNAIDRIFHAMSLSLSYYAEDPDFYRTLWTEALDMSGKETRTALITPQRYAFWWALISEASREGALLAALDLDLLLRNLDLVFGSVMLAWVLGGVEVEDLEPAVGFGYALALRGAASADSQARIEKRLMDYQKQLLRRRKKPLSA